MGNEGSGGVGGGRTSLTAAQQIEIKIYVHMFEFIARLWVPGIQTPASQGFHGSGDQEHGALSMEIRAQIANPSCGARLRV